MRLLRAAQANPLHRRIVEERAEFLAEGAHRPIISESGLRVRNFLLVITCKLPLSAPEPTAKDIERAKDMRLRFEQSMSTVGLAPRPMTADDYLEITDTILNRDASAGWRHGIASRIDLRRIGAQGWRVADCRRQGFLEGQGLGKGMRCQAHQSREQQAVTA